MTKDNAVVGYLLSKIYLKRVNELEKEVDILVDLIKKKLPEYTDWIENNFNRGQNDRERIR